MCCQHNVIKPQLKCTPARQKLITPSMGKVNFRKITSDTLLFKFYGQEMHHLTIANMNGPNSWICPETENSNFESNIFQKLAEEAFLNSPETILKIG